MIHRITNLYKQKVIVNLTMNCENLPKKDSYNLIGEFKGTTFPDEIIIVGLINFYFYFFLQSKIKLKVDILILGMFHAELKMMEPVLY
jgi:hypothetical protein